MVEKHEAPGSGQQSAPKPASASPLKSRKVKVMLWLVGILVVVALVLWLLHWWTVGRFMQETDNAYLQADSVVVAARVGGHITDIYVSDNQTVQRGEALARIDSRNPQAMLDQADAVVAVRQADIEAARATIESAQASIEQARAQQQANSRTLGFLNAEVARFTPLARTGADTQEHVESLTHQRDQALAQLTASQAQVKVAQGQAAAARAQLAQAQAGLKQAQADAERARIPLDDTLLVAPLDGRIGDKTARVGQVVGAGTRLMTVVPLDALYISANFKETQLGLMRIGQPVEIRVDALSGQTLHGEVESISPGTGAQFALLPPENATGNFTKIVQRVPVRIRLQVTPEERRRLVAGLSVEVTVDTRSARESQASRPTAAAH